MSDRAKPHGGGLPPEVLGDDIPEAVLDELLVAFADRQSGRTGPAAKPATTPASGTTPGDDPKPATPSTPSVAPPPGVPVKVITDPALDTNETPVAEPPSPPPVAREESVVVIEADDLPDAVVLDGDPSSGGLDRDGSGASKRPSVDPRFRARRIAVRRAEGRKRLRWLIVGGGVVVVAALVLALLASPLMAIDRVDVDGAVYADRAAIQQVVDSLQGEPILTADLDGAARRLEQIPWVASARVSMHLPNRVSIEIAERAPVASFQGADGQFRVIDADAFVVAVLPNQPLDYPPITGVLPNTPAGNGAGAAVQGASQLISALPPALGDRLSSVAIGANGNLTVLLDGVDGGAPMEIVFGAPNDYRVKLVEVLNALNRHSGCVSIDVSTGDAITTGCTA